LRGAEGPHGTYAVAALAAFRAAALGSDPLEDGTMGIFTTREAVEEFVRGEPIRPTRVVRNWTIREWNEALVPDE
jgi:hypothetical protein